MKLLYAILVAVIMLPNVCSAQETDDPKACSERLLDLVVLGKSKPIVDYLRNYSKVGHTRPDAILGLKENFDKMYAGCGQANGYEFVEEKTRGSSLIYLLYIVKHDECPLAWELYFYKPKSRWNMVHFFLRDEASEIFRGPM